MFKTVTDDPFTNQMKAINRHQNKELAKRIAVRTGVFVALAVGTQLVINAVNNKTDDKSN